jgi:Arc/MetJ family transcription regulator
MGINVTIDETLVAEAMKKTGASSEEEVVEKALRLLIERDQKPKNLRDLAGKIQFYEGFDPLELRKDRDVSG